MCLASVANGILANITVTDSGTGYTNTPDVLIDAPPFGLGLEIAIQPGALNRTKVKVTEHVALGISYVLESSTDLETWSQTEAQFTAQAATVTQEFDVDVVRRYFRIRQMP